MVVSFEFSDQEEVIPSICSPTSGTTFPSLSSTKQQHPLTRGSGELRRVNVSPILSEDCEADPWKESEEGSWPGLSSLSKALLELPSGSNPPTVQSLS